MSDIESVHSEAKSIITKNKSLKNEFKKLLSEYIDADKNLKKYKKVKKDVEIKIKEIMEDSGQDTFEYRGYTITFKKSERKKTVSAKKQYQMLVDKLSENKKLEDYVDKILEEVQQDVEEQSEIVETSAIKLKSA
jgi:hypothetical protein